MSYTYFKQLLFSFNDQSQKKLIEIFINTMKTHSAIHPYPQPTRVPKMIRAEVWKKYHGQSINGACYCCNKPLDALETWNAGHVIPKAYGGPNTVENLRPICIPCNMDMGTENLYVFKARNYPKTQ